MILQLNPSIPLIVTAKNDLPGRAIALIDYGPDHDLIWVVALYDSGEIWSVPNSGVKMWTNWTMEQNFADDS